MKPAQRLDPLEQYAALAYTSLRPKVHLCISKSPGATANHQSQRLYHRVSLLTENNATLTANVVGRHSEFGRFD